jgi:hypothetical protein
VLAGGLLALALADTASAGTVSVKPTIQGAGKVVANSVCEQAPPVTNATVRECATQTIDKPGQAVDVDLVATAADGWSFKGWESCANQNGARCTVSAAADKTTTASPRAKFADSRLPTPTLDSIEPSPTRERTVVAKFHFDELGVNGKCRIDLEPVVACDSPAAFTVSEGQHTLSVAGTDLNGLNGTSTWQSFTVVDTTLTGGPADGSYSTSRSAGFTAGTGYGTGYQCSLDRDTFTACGPAIALSGLADGKHELRVRAVRGAVVDAIPAARTWTVDTTAPETTIDDSLAFSANEPATFRCSLDGAAPVACTSPYAKDRRAGTHTLRVTAVDRAGNADSTPAVATWTIAAPTTPTTPAPITPATPTPATPAAAAPAMPNAAPRLTFSVPFAYRATRTATRFSRLAVTGLPNGTAVKVAIKCKKRKGCPKGFKRTVSGPLSLKPLLRKSLRPGTKIILTASKPGSLGASKVFTIRSKRPPSVKG